MLTGGASFNVLFGAAAPSSSLLPPCATPTCDPIPVETVCSNGTDSITLHAGPGLANVVWYDGNGIQMGVGDSLTLDFTDIGTGMTGASACFFYEGVNAGGCPVESCCPVSVAVVDCCSASAAVFANVQGVCGGQSPGVFTAQTPAQGSGTLTYQWQYNTSNCDSTFTDIVGANGASYQPTGLSETTYFRQIVFSIASGMTCSDTSNCVVVNVNPIPELFDDVFQTCPGTGSYGNLVSVNDANLQNPVFTIVTPPAKGSVTINNFGAFNYTPADSQCGSVSFTYEVCNQTTGCCATANATINFGDNLPPTLQNVPADLTIACDDEVPQPPIVTSVDLCPVIQMDFSETSSESSVGACNNYVITRTWTTTDICNNSSTDTQFIHVVDQSMPEMFRVYTLPNGKKLVAGIAEHTSHLWKYVKFPIHFNAPPLLFAQVTTNNDGAAVALQTRFISTNGFEVRLREEEAADQLHGGETVSWMAMEAGDVYSSYRLSAHLFNNANDSWQNLTYPVTFSSKPVFLAAVNGTNQPDPVSIRTKSENANGLQFSLQEEQSNDAEVSHANEKMAWLALTNGADIYDHKGSFVAEGGTVSTNHNWTTVNLSNRFTKPVVLLGGLSTNGNQAAIIRVRNVTPNSFEVRAQEWDYLDGNHANESLCYLVVEGGIPFSTENYCFDDDFPILGTDLITIDNCDGLIAADYTEFENHIYLGNEISRTWTSVDDCGNTNILNRIDTCRVAAFGLKTLLQGALLRNNTSGTMRDDLRTKQLIPTKEPYTNLSYFEHQGSGGQESIQPDILNLSGNEAPVDWLMVECRASVNHSAVLSTQAAILQRDGRVIGADGSDTLFFWDLPEGNYYISARHRNHLGTLSANTFYLNSDTPPLVNLLDSSTPIYGGELNSSSINGKKALWAGDFNGDGRVIYQGPDNDVFSLFSKVLSDAGNGEILANYISVGYHREDFDLDGRTIYQGPGNDRAMLLYHTVLAHNSNQTFLANFIVSNTLP